MFYLSIADTHLKSVVIIQKLAGASRNGAERQVSCQP